jgi:hypothetical protein
MDGPSFRTRGADRAEPSVAKPRGRMARLPAVASGARPTPIEAGACRRARPVRPEAAA